MFVALLLAFIATASSQDVVTQISTFEGTIPADAPVVTSELLVALADARGVTRRVHLPAGGDWTLRLHSHECDVHLIVRDGTGAQLAEDDNGWVNSQAQVVLEGLIPGVELEVTVAAKYGLSGPYRLEWSPGAPEPLDAERRDQLALQDAFAAVAHNRERYGDVSEATARAIDALGLLLYGQAGYEQACEVFGQAAALRAAVHGEEHPLTMDSRSNAAMSLVALGRAAEALPIMERVAAFQEQHAGPDDPATAQALSNLGSVYRRLGRAEEALAMQRRVLAIRRALVGDDHPEVGAAHAKLGAFLLVLGRDAEAEASLRRAVEITRPGGGLELARALANLSTCLKGLGQLVEARDSARESIEVFEQVAPGHPDRAFAEGNLAGALLLLGQTEGALTHHMRALELTRAALPPGHPELARVTGNAARLLADTGRRAEALPLAEEADALVVASLGAGHPQRVASLTLLGGLLEEAGELDRAHQALTQAHELLGRVGPVEAVLQATLLESLGRVARGRRDADAGGWLGRAVEASQDRLGPSHPMTLSALLNLSRWHWDRGDLQACLASLERADAGRRALRDQQLALLTEDERSTFLLHRDQVMDGLLLVHGRLGQHDRAHDVLLERKGELARSLARLRGRDDGEASAERDRLVQAQARLAAALWEQAEGDAARWSAERDAAERQLLDRGRDPGATALPTTADVSAALPEGVAVLNAYVGHGIQHPKAGVLDRLRVLVVRADRPVVGVDLGDVSELTALARELLEELAGTALPDRGRPLSGASLAAGDDPGQREQLSRRLLDPLLPHLEGVERLVISPTAFLHDLPLGVLLLPDGRCAVERFETSVCQDVGGWLSLDAGPVDRSRSLLAVGDVAYAPASGWAALPGTRAELAALGERYAARTGAAGAPVELTRRAATPRACLAELGDHGLLHLATHGAFLGVDVDAGDARGRTLAAHPGLASALVLAPDRDGGAVLTAEQVGWLDLSDVELAVLSACESGRGVRREREGLVSLGAAFSLAGARHVVSTAWRIPDAETARLMDDFYAGLFDVGLEPGAALRAAQLAALERQRDEQGHDAPEVWGAYLHAGPLSTR